MNRHSETNTGVADHNDRLLSRNELAIRWGVSTKTLKRREAAGELPALALNDRTVRYRLSQILEIERDAEVQPVS